MTPPRRTATANDRAARTLEQLKGLLSRFATEGASKGKQLLAAELQEVHDAIVAQAARQGFVYHERELTPQTDAASPPSHGSEVIDLANRRGLRRRCLPR